MSENTKHALTHTKKEEGDTVFPSFYDRMHLKMISLMHDTFYGAFVSPYRLLAVAGLRQGQMALEVGCGPGFFTIPAAEILGPEGYLYTIDLNPAAVMRVRHEVEQKGLKNVNVTCANAAKTNLEDVSIDLVFLFGVVHSLKDVDSIVLEMNRILKQKGTLAVEKSSWSEDCLLKTFTKNGLFKFVGKESRIYRFEKAS